MADLDAGTPVVFSEDYYEGVIRDHGYNKFELQRFNFDLGGLNAAELNLRYLCHFRAPDFLAAATDSRIITTGFGMSGAPHMGTMSQIIKMIKFQEAGERCQIVLGDLDAHNGKGRDLGEARELADRFSAFCMRLGFDSTTNVLRAQWDDIECLRNLYLLSYYALDSDFDYAEEDNHRYYASLGVVDSSMTFRRKVSLALMTSDFITLGQHNDAVLVMLGVDEHRYVRFAQALKSRFDSSTVLRGSFALSALYTRISIGFDGQPKMSKSIPGSSIGVTSTPEQIVERIARDETRNPDESPVYQLIYQMFFASYDDTLRLRRECAVGSPAWQRAKNEFADHLIELCCLW